jgi:1-acyl-sn-glycerol-3-phosphate acyltransferase
MPFRSGAFQTAAQAGVPVLPIALRGVRSALRDETWYLRRTPIRVAIGAPVAPEGADWNATVKLRDQVRAVILRNCGEPDLA